MTAAVVGLIGVLLGALMTQLGAFLTDRRQIRNEAIRWCRDQKSTAYDNTIRHLVRAISRRSGVTVNGGGLMLTLDDDGVRQFFDDLGEAQFWIHALATRCEVDQMNRITQAAETLGRIIREMGDPAAALGLGKLRQVLAVVTECAHEDRSG
ncbi:hypothetical protein ABIA39_007863 [Nocardia sp. GAS34]|uniref:hypothetical protein n=1 Tax=unclassified Nocardia TaxID=2637762 RepID=UPI003D1E2103